MLGTWCCQSLWVRIRGWIFLVLRLGQIPVVLEMELLPFPRDGGREGVSTGPSPRHLRGGALGRIQPPGPQCSGSSTGGSSGGGRLVLTVRKEARWHPCLSSAVLFYTNTIFQTCFLQPVEEIWPPQLADMSLRGGCRSQCNSRWRGAFLGPSLLARFWWFLHHCL